MRLWKTLTLNNEELPINNGDFSRTVFFYIYGVVLAKRCAMNSRMYSRTKTDVEPSTGRERTLRAWLWLNFECSKWEFLFILVYALVVYVCLKIVYTNADWGSVVIDSAVRLRWWYWVAFGIAWTMHDVLVKEL